MYPALVVFIVIDEISDDQSDIGSWKSLQLTSGVEQTPINVKPILLTYQSWLHVISSLSN